MSTSFLAPTEELQGPMTAIIAEIVEVEKVLSEKICSDVELVANVGSHTLRAGGKRLRPALVVIAARATGLAFDPVRARELGACMEMIHMATLIHDDVVDHAATRRGASTASAVFGNTASILAGDVLLAKAMCILAQDGDLRIIRRVSQAVVDLAQGEVRELESRGEFGLTEDEHLQILRMKTATFIQCCCEVGALIAKAPPHVVDSLGRYGYAIGMAFQLVDDLLDYQGDQSATGKPFATDFREGCATLPLIHLRATLTEAEEERVRRWFGNGATEKDLRSLVSLMHDRGAFQAARKAAEDQVAEAIGAADGLPQSADRKLLQAVAEFILSRNS